MLAIWTNEMECIRKDSSRSSCPSASQTGRSIHVQNMKSSTSRPLLPPLITTTIGFVEQTYFFRHSSRIGRVKMSPHEERLEIAVHDLSRPDAFTSPNQQCQTLEGIYWKFINTCAVLLTTFAKTIANIYPLSTQKKWRWNTNRHNCDWTYQN